MNNFCFKLLISLFSLVISFETFALDGDLLLLEFENKCSNAIDPDLVECDELATQMTAIIEEESDPTSVLNPRAMSVFAQCSQISTPGSSLGTIEALATGVEESAMKMSCTEDDAKDVQSSCTSEMLCNLGRSVATAADKVAPRFISRKIRSGMQGVVSKMGGGSQCLSSDKSDCLTEVVSAFVANIVGTFNTLKDVAKLAVKSIWGLKDYLTRKSDAIHEAASQRKSEISLFMDNPGEYIISKFTKLKNSVDTWVKKEVFCQKWEGHPHNSKCLEPLESYSCLNCSDGMNAFCAATGVLASESLIAITTAGTMTAANIALKAGIKVGANVATKAAARIAAKVPALNKVSKAKSATGSTLGNTVSTTLKTTVSISKVTLDKMSDAIKRFKTRVGESRITKAVVAFEHKVEGAIEFVTKPVNFLDDLADDAVHRVLTRAASTTSNSQFARTVRASAHLEKRSMLQAAREGVKGSSQGNRIVGTRVFRQTMRNDSARDSLLGTGTKRSERSGTDKTAQFNHGEANRSDPNLSAQRKSSESTVDTNQRRSDDEEPRLPSRSLRGSARAGTSRLARGVREAAGLDLAIKGARSIIEANEETKTIAGGSLPEVGTGESMDSLSREELGRKTGQVFRSDSEAQAYIEDMKDQYADESRREEMISKYENQGYSRAAAERIYENDREFFSSAKVKDSKWEAQREETAQAIRNFKESQDQDRSSDPEIKEMTSVISGLKDRISSLNDELAHPKARPTVAPIRTASPSGTPAARRRQNYQSNSSSFAPSFAPSSTFSGASAAVAQAVSTESDTEGEVSEDVGRSLASVDGEDIGPQGDANAEKLPEEVFERAPNEIGKADYLDLYLKLMEMASTDEGIVMSDVSDFDERLTAGEITGEDFKVLGPYG